MRRERRAGRIGAALTGVLVAGAVLAGCGSSSKSTPNLPATKKTSGFPSYMITAPAGYAVSKDPGSEGAVNGPVTPAAFDKTAGKPGLSAEIGLLRAYDVAFDASGSRTIDSTIFTFSSSADAVRFATDFAPGGLTGDAPTKSALAGVPGGAVLSGTKKDDGFYYTYAIATKGVTAMIVQYEAEKLASPPPGHLPVRRPSAVPADASQLSAQRPMASGRSSAI